MRKFLSRASHSRFLKPTKAESGQGREGEGRGGYIELREHTWPEAGAMIVTIGQEYIPAMASI